MTAGPSLGSASAYPTFRTPALICFSEPKDVFVPLLIILFTFLILLFVSSAPKYRRRRARSQRSSPLISYPTGFLLKKQRAGTRERTFFRPGPLTRGSWSARKSAIIEAEKWRGDLKSLCRPQNNGKGVDPPGR